MDTLWYLGKLALSLAVGSFFAKAVGKDRFVRTAALAQMLLVWALLFFMGVNTASIEGIGEQLSSIGLGALVLTVCALGGTIVIALLFLPLYSKERGIAIAKRKEGSTLRQVWDVMKEPAILIGIVILGMIARLGTPFFGWFDSSLVSILLYLLLFFVGMQVVQLQVSFKGIFTNKALILLPAVTIVGTYLGAAVAALLLPYTLQETMGMLSGFGWYSLSGVMIGDLGYPILGSISFLSNLLRESFTFFLIPLFGRLGRRFYPAALCSGGATTMDVTLVLLSNHFGMQTMVLSIFHGVVMSFSAPLLIPLFF
ncbi:MAG TPA: lysine exporter LysO family protein [Sphaerochaeta sp.]|nr:lysine exporter LysO family protein [Sphaerochaeta sp.]